MKTLSTHILKKNTLRELSSLVYSFSKATAPTEFRLITSFVARALGQKLSRAARVVALILPASYNALLLSLLSCPS